MLWPRQLVERIHRRIDGFLDRAESAAHAFDWPIVLEAVRAVLAIEPETADAKAVLAMAEANRESTADAQTQPTPADPRRLLGHLR